MSKDFADEVEKNYQVFRAMLPSVIGQHRNKFALMKDAKVVGFYSTLEDAYVTAGSFFAEDAFSVQKVTDVPVDLGFFSHAADIR